MKSHFLLIPTITGSMFIDETRQTVLLDNLNPNFMELVGQTVVSEPGTYPLSISLKYPEEDEWEDGTTTPKILNWIVSEVRGTQNKGIRVFPVPTVQGILVVNATEQHVIIENLDNIYMELSGTTKAQAAGTYTVTVSLKYPEATQWKDGTTNSITLQWTIDKLRVPIPEQYGSLYYNGQKQKPTFMNYNPELVSFDTTNKQYFGIESNTYNIKVKLKYPDSTIWEDGTSKTKTIKWKIKRKILNIKPSFFGSTFYFNAEYQGPKLINYDPDTMKITGKSQAMNVGTYSCSITPADNYCWEEVNDTRIITPVTWNWEILPIKIQKPTMTNTTLVYNGKEQSPIDINGAENLSLSGTYTATDVGTYQATIRLPNANYTWEDGTRDPYIFIWNILPSKITELPYAQVLSYNGKEQYPEWKNVHDNQYYVYGDFSASIPGTYYVGFMPTNNYVWGDGTRSIKRISWKIVNDVHMSTYNLVNSLSA